MDLEDTYPIFHPASIEEPTSPDVSGLPMFETEPNDIKMRSQSWYEPEKDRIVVTDLDGSDDESDANSSASIDISTALLDRIKDHRAYTSASLPLPSASTALVLFRPLTYCPSKVVKKEPVDTAAESSLGDDAMDTEI